MQAGKLADFVILSEDPTAIDPELLASLEVLQTVKRGTTIYQHEDDGASAPGDSVAVGDVISRMLNHWQHSHEQSGSATHSHGPELLMGALLAGLENGSKKTE